MPRASAAVDCCQRASLQGRRCHTVACRARCSSAHTEHGQMGVWMKKIGLRSSKSTEYPVTQGTILPLVVHDLCYEIGGKRLLDGISFRTDAGPRTVVLGPNGAGKSLLLRLCHGLLQPSAGTIAWAGTAPATARRCQAMVFQRPVLLRRSTAANITYVLRLQGIPRRQRRAMMTAALEQAGLLPLAARPARVLSGGEQQRL